MSKHSVLAEEIVRALFIESFDGAFFDSLCSIVDRKLSGARSTIYPFAHSLSKLRAGGVDWKKEVVRFILDDTLEAELQAATDLYESLKVD